MFVWLTDLAVRPRRVLVTATAWLVVAAVIGGPLPRLLHAGPDLLDPSSQSQQAARQVARATGGEGDPLVLALVRPAHPDRVAAVAARLRSYEWAFSVTRLSAAGRPGDVILAVRTRR